MDLFKGDIEYKKVNGYYDFVLENYLDIYNDSVFKARHQLISKGYYQPLIDQLKAIMAKYQIQGKHILDLGVGEATILESIKGDNIAYGIDLSQSAIKLACEYYPKLCLAIADINDLPFIDNSFDCLINILSPNNYDEFMRVLKADGIMIKVIPNEMISASANTYKSNAKERFFKQLEEHFEVLEVVEINQEIAIAKEDQQALIEMNPPLWDFDEIEPETSLLLDLSIIVTKKLINL